MLCFICLQPAQWQLSADGKRLIGHMTLRKPISDNDSVEGRAGEAGGAVGRGALGKCVIIIIIIIVYLLRRSSKKHQNSVQWHKIDT